MKKDLLYLKIYQDLKMNVFTLCVVQYRAVSGNASSGVNFLK